MAKLDGIKVINENTVEYNGFVYELVTGDAKAADVIKASEQELDVTEGAFYLVVDIDDDNDIVFKDNVDDSNYFNQGEHSVFRKSYVITTDKLTDAEGVVKIELPDGTKLEGTPSDLEKITRKLQEMQAEQGSSVEIKAEVEETSESVSARLQVGDYAKVVEEGSHSAKVGDIVKIFVDDEDNQPFKCEDLQGKELRYPWFREHELVKATDEEVLEAKQALLKEGDFARVIANTTCHSFEIGTIVKLDDYAEETDAFTAYYIDGSDFWRIYRSDLEPLTKEEAEHIEREAEEEKKAKAEHEKWAAIGREVGEIKDGDVVKVIGKGPSDHKIGDVGEVSDSSKCLDGQYSFRVNTESLKFVNWLGSELVELIVPVEQRFDTVG
ncbi:hypothetical protein CN454_29140 [Bacillus cereus]|uniref:hypothetical protein n=1 Tax=Bacillus cereus TaxID=1396 RepID=UPI000BF50258|nr:hypothetical protein [Bacillus cereus]PEX05828.1 hypothetical protein CN454_29140 [Bacillus cereus]PGS64674.1 hypothetical protein COD08_30695 [Bacillus cereus]